MGVWGIFMTEGADRKPRQVSKNIIWQMFIFHLADENFISQMKRFHLVDEEISSGG